MKSSLNYRIKAFLLPGLKRWIAVILIGIAVIVFGVFLLLGYHPVFVTSQFIKELMQNAVEVLPHRISGIMVIVGGALIVCIAMAKVTLSVLRAYLPEDRESIPDVLYRRRHLDRGPRVVVLGGGHGLSNLLRGLKNFTNNITAVVTVGDDGGSSGRLRQELGVLPPGDIRNCITALADEDKLVTELFRYRFEAGAGLEGHSFGNLFLTALCSLTNGDMLQAVKVASRVLNSCGQVLPSSLTNILLVAELEDGRVIKGESRISEAGGNVKRMSCEPAVAKATPEALQAIAEADLIVIGPGSLYTSIVPNLLVEGLSDAIRQSHAKKIYISNIVTQCGETANYSVADHIEALLRHSNTQAGSNDRLIQAVLVNDQLPTVTRDEHSGFLPVPVSYDADRIRELGIIPVRRPLLSESLNGHHDPYKLAKTVMVWYYQGKRRGFTEHNLAKLAQRERLASLF